MWRTTHIFMVKCQIYRWGVRFWGKGKYSRLSGIGKMEDNLTSADPLSYTTNGKKGVAGKGGLLVSFKGSLDVCIAKKI